MQNATVTTATGKIKAVPAGAITVDEIKDGFKGKEAQIRQVFVKSYPSQRTSNEFKDSLFSNDELGIEETPHEEVRVSWIPVGKKHKVKDVEAALAKTKEAILYKVLSFEPIITSDQRNVLSNGLSGEALSNFLDQNDVDGDDWTAECSKILYDKIASAQLVVYGEENNANKPADEPVLFQGKKQYRQVFFSMTHREDIDYRVDERQSIPELVLATEEVEESVKA